MGAAIGLKAGLSAEQFRAAAKRSRDANQARRLLALAAIREGRSRTEAARIGGMDRQTLPDWVHAYNEFGIDGLVNAPLPGRRSKLSAGQKEELIELVRQGPDLERDGLVRWRRIDLARIIEARHGIKVDPDTIGRILAREGYSYLSARPRHPDQDKDAIELFKNAA